MKKEIGRQKAKVKRLERFIKNTPDVDPLALEGLRLAKEELSEMVVKKEINTIEDDNPGISAQAVAEKLDITQENIDLPYKMVGRFKKSLQNKRVAALC